MDAVMKAYDEVGIRVVFALQYADRKGIDTIPFLERHISVRASPAAVHIDRARTSTRSAQPLRGDAIQCANPTARKLGARAIVAGTLLDAAPAAHDRACPPLRHPRLHSHLRVARHGASGALDRSGISGLLIERLAKEGVLDPRLNFAHSVWLSPAEIEMLAEHGAGVVLNPQGNLKMKCGIAPIRLLQNAGVRIGLGCDNCSCSDAQNMFVAMKLFTLLAAVSDPMPGPPQALNALHAATEGGAEGARLGQSVRTHRARLQGRSHAHRYRRPDLVADEQRGASIRSY